MAEVAAMVIARAEFLNGIADERDRQDVKWGKNFVGIDRMIVILGEEIGEICNAHLESSTSRAGPRTHTTDDLLKEIVQSAAVLSKLFELIKAGSR